MEATSSAAPTIPASFFSSAVTMRVRRSKCGKYSSERFEIPPPMMKSSGENRNSTWER
ncbi:hypothetical protein AHiyo1_33310 [Arthrobacter sp. Hiyo1]|nr:hypothetical protein AHiyo1_33310 [Arthrobacter sp. Hiyo1]